MPPTTRIFVKASLLYLAVGATLGALLLIQRWAPLGPAIPLLKASHVEMLLVGWLTQLIMGVAWWLFPPLPTGQTLRGQAQRGSESLFWVTFVLLNAGVLLRAIGEPVYGWTRSGFFGFLSGTSGSLVLLAAAAFVVNMYRRVRELGRRQ